MEKEMSRSIVVLGVLLAVGMSTAAFIVGMQARRIPFSRQSISVKGLAEKPIKADLAEWAIGIKVQGQTFSEALDKLRKSRPTLDQFLKRQGFEAASLQESSEIVSPNMVTEELANQRTHEVQKGFVAEQEIMISTQDLAKIQAASKAVLQLSADGHPVFFSSPSYLVSNLEDVKMSLISAATENAYKRAQEFTKHGDAKVGAMRSASQGAFYILAPNVTTDLNDYGGAYDKTTVDKIARVVVTIDYNIER